MKKTLVFFIIMIMLAMIAPVSAQQLGGEQVYAYLSKSDKESFDRIVFNSTGRHFGFSGGRGGMPTYLWQTVDYVILEGNRLIPIDKKGSEFIRKERYALTLNSEMEVNRMIFQLRPLLIRGEQFEDVNFTDKSANETSPQVDQRSQQTVLYTNAPDVYTVFLRENAEVFRPDEDTRSFSRGYAWKVLPGPDGVDLAKKRKMKIDLGLTFIPPADVQKTYKGYDELSDYYSKNNVPSSAAAGVFQSKLLDDHKLTADDIRSIPEGFYALIPTKPGTDDALTWEKFQAIRLVIISHKERSLPECDECEEAEEETKEAVKKTVVEEENEPVAGTPEKDECNGGDIIITTNNYYGSMPDTTKAEEEELPMAGKPNLRGFLMGGYGKTMHDDDPMDAFTVHVGYYPFKDSTFWRRLGFGVGYEGGGYSWSRELMHWDLPDGYYGKSLVSRSNGHFDGVYGSIHLIPVTNNVQRDWLSLYGSVGYRWYRADESALGQTFNASDIVVEENSALISPVTKEMWVFGFGLHVKPWRWFTIGVDAKMGKSAKGFTYTYDDVPGMMEQYSGKDDSFIMKSFMVKAGFCF